MKEHFCPEVPKCEIKMGEIKGNWQPAKFYCSEIKLIHSIRGSVFLALYLITYHVSLNDINRFSNAQETFCKTVRLIVKVLI